MKGWQHTTCSFIYGAVNSSMFCLNKLSLGYDIRNTSIVHEIRSPHKEKHIYLELIAEYDPFVSEHVAQHGDPGSGLTSYL